MLRLGRRSSAPASKPKPLGEEAGSGKAFLRRNLKLKGRSVVSFQTEFEFTLPCGYVDEDGAVHREGVMRLSTAADEILPLKDPRVQSNSGYLMILLLSRVVTRIGTLEKITPEVIERLYTADLEFLHNMYERINAVEPREITVVCPRCGQSHLVPIELQFTEH